MVDWVNGFIIPIIEVSFIGGIILFIGYYFGKAFYNAWSKSVKFILKYQIFRKKYPESTIKWIVECMDAGIGWYDAKKMLMVKMYPTHQINETLWIYDQIIKELKIEKGGVKNERKHERSLSESHGKQAKLPTGFNS